jgi:hypothetical protein
MRSTEIIRERDMALHGLGAVAGQAMDLSELIESYLADIGALSVVVVLELSAAGADDAAQPVQEVVAQRDRRPAGEVRRSQVAVFVVDRRRCARDGGGHEGQPSSASMELWFFCRPPAQQGATAWGLARRTSWRLIFAGEFIRNCTMRPAVNVQLVPGRVYRTEDLARWGANPTRLAQRLVGEGRLRRLAHGLFHAPLRTRFGDAPPTAEAVLRALLKGDDYVFTGPERWNALGLGTTAVLPSRLVYNRRRTGEFDLPGQRLQLRRVAFPKRPTPEWYVVDLLENLRLAGADAAGVEKRLRAALVRKRFDIGALRAAAGRYGTQRTRELVERVAPPSQAA